jgi:hypothetical protein
VRRTDTIAEIVIVLDVLLKQTAVFAVFEHLQSERKIVAERSCEWILHCTLTIEHDGPGAVGSSLWPW